MVIVVRVLLLFHFLEFMVYFWDGVFYMNWSCEGQVGIRLVWRYLLYEWHLHGTSQTALLLLLFLQDTLCISGFSGTWNEAQSPNRRDTQPLIQSFQGFHPYWAQIWSSLRHLRQMGLYICSVFSKGYFLHFYFKN